MKPKQTLKNYHNSNVPSYQHSNTSTQPTLRDIDLAKLGLNLDEMPNLQANSNPSNQDDIMKCLEAIYGKNSTEILQKLPTLNDWPMQSVSPPDFTRNIGPGTSGGNSGNNISAAGNSATCFSNITNDNHSNSAQSKQDLQFANSQHPHQTSTISQFRASASKLHSPQTLSQQRSVLSLHQHHHQNDMSTRRLNHHIGSTNASFANLSAASASTTASASTSSLETNNLSTLCGGINKNSGSSGVTNIMDTLGSIDGVFYDGSMQINKDNTSVNQQSLIRHQQLQKLLKATGSQVRSSSSVPTATLSHRNEPQPQRTITSNNNMPQAQQPLSSSTTTISPPQAASNLPKSLLNLAACSSSSPTSTNTPSLPSGSKFSSMVSQLNLRSARNAMGSQGNLISNSNTGNNIRSIVKTTSGNNNDININAFNQKGLNGSDHNSNMSQHMTRSTTTNSANITGPSNKSNSRQIQWSLLSDDQSPAIRSNSRTVCNANATKSNPVTLTTAQKVYPNITSKEAFLASFQERAARAGVSIGEINKQPNNVVPNTSVMSNNVSSLIGQQNNLSISPTQPKEELLNVVDRKEIESALSRVEARNDLSLLYPPMLLATNSQKQINALSAGLYEAEDSELFTKEVRKIILEECNIIYECKECNNLFRSLANLVKHKRSFCLEHSSDRNNLDMNKRSLMSSDLSSEQSSVSNNNAINYTLDVRNDSENDHEQSALAESRLDEPGSISSANGTLKSSERRQGSLINDLKMLRMIRNQEKKKSQDREVSRLKGLSNNSSTITLTPQTSLSRILQSQPKNRLPVSRDSALIGALNMTPISTTDSLTNNSSSAYEKDKNTSDVHEQLVRSSSLAITLLNEKARSSQPRQSLIELSKVLGNDSELPLRATKRVAPKRKFLEDCIQKVKRDKLLTEDDEALNVSRPSSVIVENPQNSVPESKESILASEEMESVEGSKWNNSGDESDMLMIDLESPHKKTPIKRSKRRVSVAASSTGSSSSSVKLNTSSALLKALTRPVDTKRPYTVAPVSAEIKLSQEQQQNIVEEKPQSVPQEDENVGDVEVLSPLFDKYTCDICDNDHNDLVSLMSHIIDRHKEEKMVYPCIFCSLSFITLENVCRHIIDIHKKPKAQVHRLKEVVRSRSFISSDFLACSDHPIIATTTEKEPTTEEEPTAKEVVKVPKTVEETVMNEESSSSTSESSSSSSSSSSGASPEARSSYSSSSSSSSSSSASTPSSSPSPTSESSPEAEKASLSHSVLQQTTSPSTSKIIVDDVELSSDDESSQHENHNSKLVSIGKHFSLEEESSVQQRDTDQQNQSSSIKDSDSEVDESEDVEYDSSPAHEFEKEQVPEETKQDSQTLASLNKTTAELNPSSSSAVGTGGIMKLKIQLKTRPDEKSKVYEIV